MIGGGYMNLIKIILLCGFAIIMSIQSVEAITLASEGKHPEEHRVEDDPHGPHVDRRLRIGFLETQHFRRHIRQGSRCSLVYRLVVPSNPEIDQLLSINDLCHIKNTLILIGFVSESRMFSGFKSRWITHRLWQ